MECDTSGEIFITEEELPYEEDILRNPYTLKSWLRYIDFKRDGPLKELNVVYERALKQLPGSYKLWYGYLRSRRSYVRDKCPTDPEFLDVNNAHERGLVFMHKMPRIWMDYTTFLMNQGWVTRTRRGFDRALRALPITQHDRIWPLYLKFAEMHASGAHEMFLRVYRRYVKFARDDMERFIDALISHGDLNEAAMRLRDIIDDEDFVSKRGRSKHTLWKELCELMCKNPLKVTSLRVDPIIRQGIRRYTDQVGILWNSLADYYIRAKNFPRAHDIYEEAVNTVITVRDFSQVFDAYAEFLESLVTTTLEILEEEEDSEARRKLETETELAMARMTDLMDRRPLLHNSVLLRQNPHNVHVWTERVKLYEGNLLSQIDTYTEAVTTIDPSKAVGKPHTLWVDFAKFYERNDQLEDARLIFEKATDQPFKSVDDLASVWCEWVEVELTHKNVDKALKLLAKASTIPERRIDYHDRSETVQRRLHKSLKLWSLYADIEESFGTFNTCKAVYDHILDLRIATPLTVINYGLFLEGNNYFEEAFKAYEKGIGLFRWPHVYDIWATYLTKFSERYQGRKLERARDLYEQCLKDCLPKFAKTVHLMYAKLEEDYGMAKRAMDIYERATKAVPVEERFEMFNIFIGRIVDLHGVTYTRPVYERAIEELPEESAIKMTLTFADMERKLGEVDRSRAIYAYGSQMCDPRVHPEFWEAWHEFESAHGNRDTLAEMLRIRRSVQASYNTQINVQALRTSNQAPDAGQENEMQRLEATAARPAGAEAGSAIRFVRGETMVRNGDAQEKKEEIPAPASVNEERIDIDMDEDDDEEEETEVMELEPQRVPTEVFQGMKEDEED